MSRVGVSIAEVFASRGEPGFRALERQLLAECLASPPAVVAVGGGALCDGSAWRVIEAAGAVSVVLGASPEVLAGRTAGDDRPLLRGTDAAGRRERLAELLRTRAPWYRRADRQVDTTGRSLAEVAESAAAAALEVRAATVPVRLGARSYRVSITPDGLEHLGAEMARRLPPNGPQTRVGLVSDDTVMGLHGPAAGASLKAAGYEVAQVTFPAGEVHKHLGTWQSVVDGLLEAGLQRGAPVVALGGGVVGDLAGFAAASLHRGCPVVQVPTTLLAMVDASVGGKTGVDHAVGKNLVGAFHQPSLVHAALGTLATLPEREYVAGLGEVVKYALLEPGGSLLARLEAEPEAILARQPEVLHPLVRRCVALKAAVVEADEVEAGARRQLNLGHTMGHALEVHTGYGTWRHGEAVALGLLAAIRVGTALGDCPAALEARVARVLGALGLPTDPALLLDPAVIARVASDKKMSGHAVHFVVPVEGGGARVTPLTLETLQTILTGRGEG